MKRRLLVRTAALTAIAVGAAFLVRPGAMAKPAAVPLAVENSHLAAMKAERVDLDTFDWRAQTAEWWQERLTAEQVRVCRQAGTEPPFTGAHLEHKGPGVFVCAGCGQELFDAKTKFDSGTGWPSFYDALPGRVTLKKDLSHGMIRTEVLCSRCDSHLGHVFEDGPAPTGQRYCINSVCLLSASPRKQSSE